MIRRTDVELEVFELELLGNHKNVQSSQRLACPNNLAATDYAPPGILTPNPLSPTTDSSMINSQSPAKRPVTLAPLEWAVQFREDGAGDHGIAPFTGERLLAKLCDAILLLSGELPHLYCFLLSEPLSLFIWHRFVAPLV
jgi:hypothetical protein